MTTFTVFGFSILGLILLMMSTTLASKLSAVSIESAPSGAMISTAMLGYAGGKASSKAYKGSKSVSKSVGKGLSKSIDGVSGISRKAGDAGSKAHQLLKQTGTKARAERKSGGKKR